MNKLLNLYIQDGIYKVSYTIVTFEWIDYGKSNLTALQTGFSRSATSN
jgi:hypothetical protein